MKWEKYKSLTQKEKEEYDFKFGSSLLNSFRPSTVLYLVIILWEIMINGMFLLYIVFSDTTGVLEKFQDGVVESFNNMTHLTGMVVLFVAIYMCIQLFFMIRAYRQKNKWEKKHLN